MVSQPIRCTDSGVTTGTGELLPHLFTLIRQLADGYFLLHYYILTDIFPLGSMVLYVARTFLSASRRNDGTACCTAKVINPYYMMKGTEFGYFCRKNNNVRRFDGIVV